MKNIIKIMVAFITLTLVTVSCNKETTIVQPRMDQKAYESGVLLLPVEEYNLLPVALTPRVDFRLRDKVVLNCPPVGDQGGEGSCVAFGTTYAGLSISWAIYKGYSGFAYDVDIFSPEFVYNQVKLGTSCSSGTTVPKALDLLKRRGACRWSLMPYTDLSCNTEPNAEQKADAANYDIWKYARCSITPDAIKSFLASGKPVIVAGPIDNNFHSLGNDAVLYNRTGTIGNHCYCVVGYDDAKNAFIFLNSWGTNWGSLGFGWIGYDYIDQWWSECYVLYN